MGVIIGMKLDDIKSILSRAGKMQFPENRDAVRALGADSMVLLKNNGILPMNRGKIALFGAGAVDTIYTGLFFNYVYTDKNVSVKEGLLEKGFDKDKIIVFNDVRDAYPFIGELTKKKEVYALFENDLPDTYNEK